MSQSSSSSMVPFYNACKKDCFFYFTSHVSPQIFNTQKLQHSPQVGITIQLVHRQIRYSPTSADEEGMPNVDYESNDETDPFTQDFPLRDFLRRTAVEKAISVMLYDVIDDVEECERLSRPLSILIHHASVDADKKGVESQGLSVSISVSIVYKSVLFYDENRALAAAVQDSEGGDTLRESKWETLTCPQFGDERQLENACSVCLEDLAYSEGEQLVYTTCGHVFHHECIARWRESSSNGGSCPMCRFDCLID